MAAPRIDVREVPREESPAKWRKALERLEVMKWALDSGHLESALLQAVLAAIAAADAFTIRHSGVVCASERHEDAVRIVRRVTGAENVEEAASHLSRLLKAKGAFEYSGRYPRPDEARNLCEHARRFVEFVDRNLA
jgi:HEPN domain-containing protein